jgi:hypothetical protein
VSLSDVHVESLVPSALHACSVEEFFRLGCVFAEMGAADEVVVQQTAEC